MKHLKYIPQTVLVLLLLPLIGYGQPICPDNLVITGNVTTGTDQRQASGIITASNMVGSGATAIYHAGNEVLLTPGFEAVNGSSFRAYIEGCSGNYQFRIKAPSDETIAHAFRQQSAASGGLTGLGASALSVSPNPFTNKLAISYIIPADNSRADLQVYSMTGVKVADLLQEKQKESGHHSIDWDAADLPGGMYLIILTTDSGKETKRVMKSNNL